MKNIVCFVLLVAFLLPLCAYNCQKEKNYSCLIFEGIVIDSYTNKPIKNGIVKAYLISNGLLSSQIEKAETQTNKKGYFELRLEGVDLYKLRHDWEIICQKEGYLFQRVIDAGVKIKDIDSTNFDIPIISKISIIPSGELKFNISKSSSDFYYELDYGNTPERHYYYKESKIYTCIHEVAGDRMTRITFFRGVSEFRKDSIYVGIGETKVKDINL